MDISGGGGGGNGEMANSTNEKGKFAIAIFRHFSPLVVFEIRHSRHLENQYLQSFYRLSIDVSSDPTKFQDDWPSRSG